MLREITSQEIKALANEAVSFIGKCDWSKSEFSLEKAALGAILSQIAYCAIDNDEREAATRAKIVPSDMFQQIVGSGSKPDIINIGSEAELPIEVVRTATLVSTLIKKPNIVLIAIRGTQFMYELNIDAQAQKWFLDVNDEEYFLHDGFVKDAILLSARLHRTLSPYLAGQRNDVKICVFGHSLGGAVAAILKYWGIAEIGSSHYVSYNCLRRDYPAYLVEHCYTYGAPRIGSERICRGLRTYAVRREGDVIPLLPLKKMGYGDYLEQYTCKGLDWRARNATSNLFQKVVYIFKSANAYNQHLIDGYKTELIRALTP